MWGYIPLAALVHGRLWVPSLYVRVYRRLDSPERLEQCSLIICEGISGYSPFFFSLFSFPHYMWGYIALVIGYDAYKAVPSLYVRVYHLSNSLDKARLCSLIICEGISALSDSKKDDHRFPHYMWGYICIWFCCGVSVSVPSLYVRVYR